MTTIVHTTDLLDHDKRAFEHSVAFALASGSNLVALHANGSLEKDVRMPDASAVLQKWGRDGSEVSYDPQVHTCCDDVIDTVLDGLRRIGPDLVVATTHKRTALGRLFKGSQAEAIAHNAAAPVLLFPSDASGFLDEEGRPALKRVVVPVEDATVARAALRRVEWLVELLHLDKVQVHVVFVGAPERAPTLDAPANPGIHLRLETVSDEDVCDAIVQRCERASLLVMATRGHDSLGDALLGSRTDRVLHRVHCPVVSVRIPMYP